MWAYTKRGKKVEDDYWEEYGLTFGASAAQIAAALDEVDEWSDAAMNVYENKNQDYVDYVHRHIEQIRTWLMYNTSKPTNRVR